MSFASVYPHYVTKAEKKGRTKEEVDEIIRWLTGYSKAGLEKQLRQKTDFRTFFDQAPKMNPNASLIKGVVDNDLYRNADLIVGYASTLMIGFISAKKNVVLVGWHPEPGIFGPDYSVYGVCHKSLNIDYAEKDYDYWNAHNLCEDNVECYQNFVKLFNFPFDGKATQRVINAITQK